MCDYVYAGGCECMDFLRGGLCSGTSISWNTPFLWPVIASNRYTHRHMDTSMKSQGVSQVWTGQDTQAQQHVG